jgi:hypothetical protein
VPVQYNFAFTPSFGALHPFSFQVTACALGPGPLNFAPFNVTDGTTTWAITNGQVIDLGFGRVGFRFSTAAPHQIGGVLIPGSADFSINLPTITTNGVYTASGFFGWVISTTSGDSSNGSTRVVVSGSGPLASGPCITRPSDGASPQSQFGAIAGTAVAGNRLNVIANGLVVGSVLVDADGYWEALPFLQPLAGTDIQVQDQSTLLLSNKIAVTRTYPSAPFSVIPSASAFLPLRHGDILISSSSFSLEYPLYGPAFTHSAVFLGGDADGTPQVAEAVITSHYSSACTNNPGSLQCGITRAIALEQSDIWAGAVRIAGFTPVAPLSSAYRDGITSYANSKLGLPYWSYGQLFGPLSGAAALWPIHTVPGASSRYTALLTQMDANKNLDTAFECGTLVWRAYLEGTQHTVDISVPNNMTAAPGTMLGFIVGLPSGGAFLDQIRPHFVLPETFVESPTLHQIL